MKKDGQFITGPGLIPLADGVHWRLDGELRYLRPTGEIITVPEGFVTDLASIPPLGLLGGTVMLVMVTGLMAGMAFGWPSGVAGLCLSVLLLGYIVCVASAYLKAYGRYTYSAVLHDWVFQTHAYGFSECNGLLRRAMKAEGTAWWERTLIWVNVQAFGYFIYQRDRLA